MGAKLSSGTAIDGIAAYQDHSDRQQFHYFPLRGDCILGDTLTDFEVSYWGINSAPYYVDLGGGDIRSSVGGILAGRARIDFTGNQRQRIVEAIEREFGIRNPRLLPLRLSEITVQPVIASNVIELAQGSTVTFPTSLQLGTTFAYNVAANNSLFATLAAGTSNTPTPRPSFAINVYGNVEFVGDPWKARIRCDLSQVWKYTRTYVSASVKWGWFTLGSASYENVVQEMIRNNIIKIDYEEGSGDPQFGRQVLEAARVLFDKINQQAIAGEGFFKFEPNPEASGGSSGGGGSSWWPWSVSVNGSYTSKSFSQTITFDETITFTGRVKIPMGASMVLAVGCGAGTMQHFNDFQDIGHGCLTQAKLDGLQNRLGAEVRWKQMKAEQYLQKLENGEWTAQKYREMMVILREISHTESLYKTRHGLFAVSPQEVESQLSLLDTPWGAAMSRRVSGIPAKIGMTQKKTEVDNQQDQADSEEAELFDKSRTDEE